MARLEEELRQVQVRADAADKRFDKVQVKQNQRHNRPRVLTRKTLLVNVTNSWCINTCIGDKFGYQMTLLTLVTNLAPLALPHYPIGTIT